MDMPKVGPSHQKLYVLAGEWQGTETMMPSPMGPGGTATGTMQARVDIDGFYVISDYAQQRDGAVTYRRHGVYGFDTTTNEYTWYWIDSMGMASVPARGTWTGDTLTFESSMPGGRGATAIASKGRTSTSSASKTRSTAARRGCCSWRPRTPARGDRRRS
jgi:hypothetical protein